MEAITDWETKCAAWAEELRLDEGGPSTALFVVLADLVGTYGLKTVFQALAEVVEEQQGGEG